MTPELRLKIEEVYEILKKENGEHGDCICVDLRFTEQGFFINYEHRLSKTIQMDGYSMKNINSNWIV